VDGTYRGPHQRDLDGTTAGGRLDDLLRADGRQLGLHLERLYTNGEGEAISAIYAAVRAGVDGLVMNPAGFLYAGYALRDCLKAVPLPYFEVHMSNIDARNMHSVTASEAVGMITGLGVDSYRWALAAMHRYLTEARDAG